MRLRLLEFILGWIIYILYDLFWKNNSYNFMIDQCQKHDCPMCPTFKQIAWFYHKRHMHQQDGIWCNAKAINLKTVLWNDLFPFTFFTLQFLPYNWTINYWIKISFLTVPAFNAKSFAIAILVFFSFFPSRHFFWTDCQKLFSHCFNFSYQENVWPRSDSFLGHNKAYFHKNCSWSCYSRCVWHMTRLMHGNHHSERPKKHKKLS